MPFVSPWFTAILARSPDSLGGVFVPLPPDIACWMLSQAVKFAEFTGQMGHQGLVGEWLPSDPLD